MKTTPYKYLVAAIEKKQKEITKIVEKQFGKNTFPKVTVSYTLNSSRTLGTHKYLYLTDQHSINLNPKLLNELKDTYIDDVFVHELAHAAVTKYYGVFNSRGQKIKPHGKEFKYFCRMFGVSGKATTNIASNSKALKERKRKVYRHIYNCKCMDHTLSTTLHNKIQRGAGYYTCKHCKSKLVYKRSKKAA